MNELSRDQVLHCGCPDEDNEDQNDGQMTFYCYFCQNFPFEKYPNIMVRGEGVKRSHLLNFPKERFFICYFWEIYTDRFDPEMGDIDPRKKIYLGEIRGNRVIVFRDVKNETLIQKFLEPLGSILTQYKKLTGQKMILTILGS
ncbi:hypothetical protein K0B04_00145 [Patescibacteria group bacterium]|nr:hypothetical protein [Patescibacteria group bacterium]